MVPRAFDLCRAISSRHTQITADVILSWLAFEPNNMQTLGFHVQFSRRGLRVPRIAKVSRTDTVDWNECTRGHQLLPKFERGENRVCLMQFYRRPSRAIVTFRVSTTNVSTGERDSHFPPNEIIIVNLNGSHDFTALCITSAPVLDAPYRLYKLI